MINLESLSNTKTKLAVSLLGIIVLVLILSFYPQILLPSEQQRALHLAKEDEVIHNFISEEKKYNITMNNLSGSELKELKEESPVVYKDLPTDEDETVFRINFTNQAKKYFCLVWPEGKIVNCFRLREL